MKVKFVVAKNLMDLSKVREVAKRLPNRIETSSDCDRFLRMLTAGPGDRDFHLILDYDVYAVRGFNPLKEQIEIAANKNGIDKVRYASFAPHEKIKELNELHPDVTFIPRSKFFSDLKTYLS